MTAAEDSRWWVPDFAEEKGMEVDDVLAVVDSSERREHSATSTSRVIWGPTGWPRTASCSRTLAPNIEARADQVQQIVEDLGGPDDVAAMQRGVLDGYTMAPEDRGADGEVLPGHRDGRAPDVGAGLATHQQLASTWTPYPDISYYLLEQREFLKFVEDTVRSTFSTG